MSTIYHRCSTCIDNLRVIKKEKEIDSKWYSENGQEQIWNYCNQATEKYL